MTKTQHETYDVVVIGAGSPGEHAVDRCQRAGLRTAVIEQELAGGECSYWACIPSKTLLRPSQIYAEAKGVAGVAEAILGKIDTASALARRDYMVSNWHDDSQVEWIKSVGATLVRGHGRIAGERTVEVETKDGTVTLTANRAVIIATGSSAAMPPIPGLGDIECWDSRGATSAKSVPESLIIIGGGVVGVEMAQAWHRLGTKHVTIVEGSERLISGLEPFAGELLGHAFQKDGIDVLTNAKVVSVSRPHNDGDVKVQLEDGRSLQAAELLVATGRRPRSLNIGIESLGLEAGRYVPVDDSMCVNDVPGKWLYAVGDINGRALLTHMGKYQARIAVGSIVGRNIAAEADLYAIPSVIFTDPIIGSVGLTEKAAREKGLDVEVVNVPTNSVAAAGIIGDEVLGSCQIVVDKTQHVIVGATFIGPETGEMIHAATIAVVGKVPMLRLYHAVPSFPTLSEVWLTLVENYLVSAKLLGSS